MTCTPVTRSKSESRVFGNFIVCTLAVQAYDECCCSLYDICSAPEKKIGFCLHPGNVHHCNWPKTGSRASVGCIEKRRDVEKEHTA